MNIQDKIKLSPMAVFLIKAVTIYCIWFLSFDYFVFYGADLFLSQLLVKLSANTLSTFGWDMVAFDRFISVSGLQGLEIVCGCSGLDLFGLYIGFIIAYPGSVKRRVIFIAGGITLLFISNVFRIIIFTLWRAYVPYFDIAHQYSGYILFYPIVLGLWYLWIKQTNIRTIDSILVSN